MSEKLNSYFIEWKFDADKSTSNGLQKIRYGILGFEKSSDKKYVDCRISIYKLNFKLHLKNDLRNDSFLWRLQKWSTSKIVNKDDVLKNKENERIQNFLRYKAVMEFQKDGNNEERSSITGIE